MITIIAISSLVLLAFLICFLAYYQGISKRAKETSDWKVDDLVSISGREELVKLKGWSENSLYVAIDVGVHKIYWDKFIFNKSASWRRNWNECKEYMGDQNPGFAPGLKVFDGIKVDGKSVEFLTEIECEVYLKQALKEDNYELADAIRKRMEKFR